MVVVGLFAVFPHVLLALFFLLLLIDGDLQVNHPQSLLGCVRKHRREKSLLKLL